MFQLSKYLQSPTGTIPLNLDVFNYLHNNLIKTYSSLEVCAFRWDSDEVKHGSCLIFLGQRFFWWHVLIILQKVFWRKKLVKNYLLLEFLKKIMKICHNFLQCKRVLKIFVLSFFEYHQI